MDDFGDLYEITGQSSNLNRDAATPRDKADQNSKINVSNIRQGKALDGFPPGRAFGSERMFPVLVIVLYLLYIFHIALFSSLYFCVCARAGILFVISHES